jgi:hypothetical protein
LLCPDDAKESILEQKDAENIFYDVRREVHGILAGTGILRDDIKVSLLDSRQLQNVYQVKYSGHAFSGLQGCTKADKDTNGAAIQYSIYLLSGLPQSHLAAICAHEYAHVWLNENVSTNRHLDSDTVEGFCELVAYKLVTGRHDTAEQRAIRANAYTRGQMSTLLAADDNFEFYRLIKWIKEGVDERASRYELNRVLVLKGQPDGLPAWQPPSPTPVPDILVLKGLSGATQNRFALINDATLGVMEKGKVRFAHTNITIRCLEIRNRSVVIQTEGSNEKQELFIRSQ